MIKRLLPLLLICGCMVGFFYPSTAMPQKDTHDLVLIHGYNNRHQWSYEFLQQLVLSKGSQNVFVVYANESDKIATEIIGGKVVTFIGDRNFTAGIQSIEEQAEIVSKKLKLLQQKQKLDPVFDIAAHSMGGLVARKVVYLLPNQVHDLVTIATPHQGTPLAREFEWLAYFVKGQEGIKSMTPAYVEKFNRLYPVENSPFYRDGKCYTIAGDADSWIDRGVSGELAVGWTLLSLKYGQDSDGVVFSGEATITGAVHVADFPNYNHYELIREGEVANKIIRILDE
ncbi:alpha/beta hydrolase [Hazenella sp. IB182357]|uniref:Alpha/beta hydrolase n=1 Tax=Polycladospora coralii TaxID=2771432 RepID=A0A926NE96_9BACL|nr:alpha/beta hydrolase [Polycladospora coralii]MBD1371964.1 alpha/beta hydrolase [Polycladospora coralii]MBS7530468.1 alpha/beta hydrolase [Polycladospora coralii]